MMKSKLVLLEWYTTSYFYKNMAFIFHIWLTVKDSVLHDSSSPLPDGHVLVSSQMCYTCEVGQKCLWCAQSSDPCRRLPPVYPPRIHLSCISQLPFTPETHTLCCRWQSRLEESSKIELIRGTVLKTNDLPRAVANNGWVIAPCNKPDEERCHGSRFLIDPSCFYTNLNLLMFFRKRVY